MYILVHMFIHVYYAPRKYICAPRIIIIFETQAPPLHNKDGWQRGGVATLNKHQIIIWVEYPFMK